MYAITHQDTHSRVFFLTIGWEPKLEVMSGQGGDPTHGNWVPRVDEWTGSEGQTGECSPVGGCNETRMLELLPWCGEAFANMMHKVEVWKRCNLSEFITYYESFTNCTESKAKVVGCYWPNHLAQGFVTDVHRRFFHNCTVDRPHWEDPPDEILIPLIVAPILLTLAMTGLVVWHSKRTDRLL
ncbi:Receptor activity-modifying protein 3 [Camelus dromedarius]|uniref:Receptor activity-modifying protein 3 n=1 Tax=Camelus dromedarius TaxID=9838 RepID=A0A5N4DZJ5_CAMDR|nr:Receptor activity-modifying protein 3 [Camelus dromedarius]